MLKGLSSFISRVVLLFTFVSPAWAANAVYLSGDTGNPLLDGAQLSFTDSDGTFTPGAQPGNTKQLSFVSIDSTVHLQFFFAPPVGQALTAGVYTDLTAEQYLLPIKPSMNVGLNGVGCNSYGGFFVVREIAIDGNGIPTDLAIDFRIHCNTDDPTWLYGSIRYNNSLPVAVDEPTAVAGPDQIALAGSHVTLDGSLSTPGNAGITSYQWNEVSGPTVTLSDPTAAATGFTAPDVDPGGADVVLQLQVTNGLALSSTDTMTVHVANAADPFTALQVESDSGDFIGKGQSLNLGALDASFEPNKLSVPNPRFLQMYVKGGPTAQWTLEFDAPIGGVLQPGVYDLAGGDGAGSPAVPGLYISANNVGGCTTVVGHFIIFDIQYANDGSLSSFAADFEQNCDGATAALHGKIRYNSTVPLDMPAANPGPPQRVISGGTVTLSGSASDPGADGGSIVSYQWTQISGPAVTLTDPNAAVTGFTSPDVPLGGADLVFELTVTDSDGHTDTEQVTVHVSNPGDPVTAMFVKTVPGDVGNGAIESRGILDGQFLVQGNAGYVFITYNGGYPDTWTFTFKAPNSDALHTGLYAGVLDATFKPASAAGLEVDGNWQVCTGLTGHFYIRELVLDVQGHVSKFAADFVQYCGGRPSPMRGKIRFNSSVPMNGPLVDPGPDRSTYAGFPVQLDGSASMAGDGTIASYAWSQVITAGDPIVSLPDPTAAKMTFIAPDVPAGGRALVFQLIVTNSLGLSSTDFVTIFVGNEDDPKTVFYYESSPGDPLGTGGSRMILPTDATFSELDTSTDFASTQIAPTAFSTAGLWTLSFSEQSGTPLKQGAYLASSTNIPTISVTKNGIGCLPTNGSFIVRDVVYGTDGKISNLAVDFVQYCSGASAPLRGALRYNSTVPILINQPTAEAGPDLYVTHTGTVTLDGSASFTGWGPMVSYKWRQTGGPLVTLLNNDQAVAQFTVPLSLLKPRGTNLSFMLTVRNSLYLSDTDAMTVTISQPDIGSLSLLSDPGDSIGLGASSTYGLDDRSVKINVLKNNSVAVKFQGAANGWKLLLAAPNKQPLAAGVYDGAIRPSRFTSASPGLSVTFGNRTCSKVSGDFNVLDVQYGGSGGIVSLAVDFDQFCNGRSAGLHGKLRYHSAVP